MSGDPRVVYGFPAVMGDANVGPRRRAPLPPRSFHRPCRGLCGAGTRWLHTRLVGQPAQGRELRTRIAGTIARNAPGRAAAVRGALGVARDALERGAGERRERRCPRCPTFVSDVSDSTTFGRFFARGGQFPSFRPPKEPALTALRATKTDTHPHCGTFPDSPIHGAANDTITRHNKVFYTPHITHSSYFLISPQSKKIASDSGVGPMPLSRFSTKLTHMNPQPDFYRRATIILYCNKCTDYGSLS